MVQGCFLQLLEVLFLVVVSTLCSVPQPRYENLSVKCKRASLPVPSDMGRTQIIQWMYCNVTVKVLCLCCFEETGLYRPTVFELWHFNTHTDILYYCRIINGFLDRIYKKSINVN